MAAMNYGPETGEGPFRRRRIPDSGQNLSVLESREALTMTVRLLTSIVNTATSGLRKPETAKGMARAL